MAAEDHEVTLLTRAGCHLCEDAHEAMVRVHEKTGVRWRSVDADADDELRIEYGDRLPVVLLDGAEHGYWRVEEARLIRDLEH
jgi:glutaredoxin